MKVPVRTGVDSFTGFWKGQFIQKHLSLQNGITSSVLIREWFEDHFSSDRSASVFFPYLF